MVKHWSNVIWQVGILLAYIVSCSWATPMRSDHAKNNLSGIGINYGMIANNLPSAKDVSEIIQNSYIDKVKIYNTDPEILQAFANTRIGVIVCLQNEDIALISKSPRAAFAWVKQRIQPYYPATKITQIAVGNEILTGKNRVLINRLLPAMENIHKALVALHMDRIKVSSPNSLAVLANSFPPSSATFQPNILSIVTNLLEFLSRTGSFFMVNAYPYFAYQANPKDVSLDYALFRDNQGVKDPKSGLQYFNLFDAQVDAMYYAMKEAGHEEMLVVVSETGWPSAGDANEGAAAIQNAQEYNINLINHLSSNPGTPYKPNTIIDTFIFALFNENLKPGPASERNFGLLHPNKSSVYDIGLFKSTTTIAPPSYAPLPSPVLTPPVILPSPISPTTSPPSYAPLPPVVVPPPIANAPPTISPPAYPPIPPVVVPPPISNTPSPSYTPSIPPLPLPSPPSVPLIPPPSPVVYPPPVAIPPVGGTPPTSPYIPPSSPPPIPLPPSTSPPALNTPIWCIANPQVSDSVLQEGLDYACSHGADCSLLQPGESCFAPNSLVAHASYAFNSYYQHTGRHYWNCVFKNAGLITPTDPSYGPCVYPSQ